MSKMILLVDSDAALRSQLSKALVARGYDVQENPDGREVVEQVRAALPDAVVLSVELPKGSGYAVCSKLRKDDGLRRIPVILTSAEATQKAFDDHKKLKNGRADEYLLKPFTADALLEKLSALVGPSGAEPAKDDALGLSDLAAEFGDEPSEQKISLEEVEEISVDEDLAPTGASLPGDADVELLETAFDQLEDHAAPNAQDLDEPLHAPETSATHVRDYTEPMAFDHGAPGHDESLESLGAEAEPAPPPAAEPPAPSRSTTSFGGGSRDKDYFQLKERLASREKDLLRLREELMAKEKELVEQREHETAVEQEASSKDDEIQKRDAQLKQLQQKVESLVAGQKRTEKDLHAAREEARTASARAEQAEQGRAEADSIASESKGKADALEEELAGARQRLSELETETEHQRGQADELTAELTGVRAQLDEANTAIEDARSQRDSAQREAEATAEELRRQVGELEEEKQKHEDRVVKAFQRLKHEELLREKAKKALAIAQQLLDEPSGVAEGDEPVTGEDEQLS